MRLNWNSTLFEFPIVPPPLRKAWRMLATVRTMLSVAVSTTMAIPCGP
jgi:hypothetical protein